MPRLSMSSVLGDASSEVLRRKKKKKANKVYSSNGIMTGEDRGANTGSKNVVKDPRFAYMQSDMRFNGSDVIKKKKKKKESKMVASEEDSGRIKEKNVVTDPRFVSMHSDPRFQKIPKRQTKVKIDERFSRMFTDNTFGSSSAASLDKRGKRKMTNSNMSLRHYYQLDDKVCVSGEDASEMEDLKESGQSESSSEASELVGQNLGPDDSTTDEEDLDFEEDVSGVEEESVPVVEEGTRRLAIVDLDWRHIRAIDLLILLRSCLPKAGDVLSVSIYPSEFGIKQMKEEEIRGPVGLFDDANGKNDEDTDEEIDYEKLRAYEKSRLRYYYAVVECDSVATADHIYKFCDGTELERSSNVLDLRFIPDSMEFKHPPRDSATDVPAGYEGLDFHTKALQHSNIPISWDEDEPQRVKKFKRHFKNDQLEEMDLKEFLASDGSDYSDKEDDVEKADRYRALIQSDGASDKENDEEAQDMEVTFNPGLEDLSKHILEKKNKKSESVWESYLKRRREKKKASKSKFKQSSDDDDSNDECEAAPKDSDDFFASEVASKAARMGKEEAAASQAELELLFADDNGDYANAKGYNLKQKKSKGKKRKEPMREEKIPSGKTEDPRFSKMFTSPLFAMDPTDPQFKRSASYARLALQKRRDDGSKRLSESEPQEKATVSLQKDHQMDDLSSLVRSIKKKTCRVQK